MPYQTYQIFLNIYNESKKRKEKEKPEINKPSEKKKIDTWEIYKILR